MGHLERFLFLVNSVVKCKQQYMMVEKNTKMCCSPFAQLRMKKSNSTKQIFCFYSHSKW